jgi:hypothetical protein
MPFAFAISFFVAGQSCDATRSNRLAIGIFRIAAIFCRDSGFCAVVGDGNSLSEYVL